MKKRMIRYGMVWALVLTTIATTIEPLSNFKVYADEPSTEETTSEGVRTETTGNQTEDSSGVTIGQAQKRDTKEDVDAWIATIGSDWPAMPQIDSEYAIAIELNSGTILYEKNSTEKAYPASVTKIMTGLLTVENASLTEEVTFSKNAIHSLPKGASNIALNTGEILSVENCMYGLLIPSANEVANGLAEHVAGSIEAFAVMMNNRADEIGCVNTHFVNANGLHDDAHYSCAYDLAIIFGECVQNPTFLRLDSVATYVIPPTNLQPEQRPIGSTNHMMRKTDPDNYDPDIICGKTGWTENSGRNLVSYTKHNGMDIIICVLGAKETPLQYQDTKTIKNYCFDNFYLANIAANDQTFNALNNTSTASPINIPTKEISLFSLDTSDCVILPVGVEFSDLQTELVYTKDKESFATINYLYDGYCVGEGHLQMASDELILQEFANKSQEEIVVEPIDFDKLDEKKHIPIRYVVIGVCVVLIAVVIFFFVRTVLAGSRQSRGKRHKGGRTNGPNFESLNRTNKRR